MELIILMVQKLEFCSTNNEHWSRYFSTSGENSHRANKYSSIFMLTYKYSFPFSRLDSTGMDMEPMTPGMSGILRSLVGTFLLCPVLLCSVLLRERWEWSEPLRSMNRGRQKGTFASCDTADFSGIAIGEDGQIQMSVGATSKTRGPATLENLTTW